MIKDMPIPDSAYYYLAALKNGTAMIGGLADYTSALRSQIKYALGGRYYVTRQYDAYSTTAGPSGDPRTAIGLLSSTKVVLLVVDGRRTGHSGGVSVTEIGLIYRALGATDAVNLDGGGSSTMVVRQANNTYEVISKPSDNSERSVANTWMILGRTVPVTVPINLKTFSGQKHGNYVKLNWTTASERNSSHFEIYRSENKEFRMPIGTLPGAGDSHSLTTYSFTDINPFAGTNYYQLKQVDFDGQSEKSHIIAVNTGTGQETFSLERNGDGLSVVISSETNCSGTIRIADMTGRVLSTTNINLQKGQNSILLNMPDASGAYVATLSVGGKNKSLKFVK